LTGHGGFAILPDMSAASAPVPVTAADVRRLTVADAAVLHAARIEALTEAPYAFASTLERELRHTEQTWRDRLASDRSIYFGLVSGGRLAAMAAGLVPGFFEEISGEQPPAHQAWHLVSMWVSPELRGQGIADALIAAVCDAALARGGTAMELWVTGVNHRAEAFYRRAGFTPTGDRQLVFPDDPHNWELKMARPLG
jgi:ribosomal protein S18 acetylase RimI-like enzyme